MFRLIFLFLGLIFSFNSLRAQDQLTPSDFLHTAKERYQNIYFQPRFFPGNLQEKVHYVLGNESADLDSIASSIAFAYLLYHENNSKQGELYIPLLNMHRVELALRKDVLYLFQLLNISADDLLFLDDDVPLRLLFVQNRLRFNLVDHNILRPSQEYLSNAVERIVDHHADENKQYPLLTPENKTIAIVGSAATLVSEKMLPSHQITMTPELATLLLGPILIDTSDLQSVEKTTTRDIDAVETLKPFASEIMPQDFYKKLLTAKNDISGLTPSMLLSKDFKEYLDGKLLYGISSIPSSISWWTEDAAFIGPVLEKYAKERELSLLILLMANNDPQGPKRKIIIYSASQKLLQAFDTYVQTDEALSHILIPGPASGHDQMSFYWTEQFIARKQLQPLFHFSEIISSEASVP